MRGSSLLEGTTPGVDKLGSKVFGSGWGTWGQLALGVSIARGLSVALLMGITHANGHGPIILFGEKNLVTPMNLLAWD